MHTLILGYAKVFLTMFVKRKKNRSGTTSVVVAEKTKGIYKELITIGVAKDSNEIDSLVNAGHEWISKEESRRHPQLDLYGEEREACDREREEVRRVLSNVSNIYKELITIGVAKDSNEIDSLVNAGHEWISKEESRRHPQPEF